MIHRSGQDKTRHIESVRASQRKSAESSYTTFTKNKKGKTRVSPLIFSPAFRNQTPARSTTTVTYLHFVPYITSHTLMCGQPVNMHTKHLMYHYSPRQRFFCFEGPVGKRGDGRAAKRRAHTKKHLHFKRPSNPPPTSGKKPPIVQTYFHSATPSRKLHTTHFSDFYIQENTYIHEYTPIDKSDPNPLIYICRYFETLPNRPHKSTRHRGRWAIALAPF